MAERRMPSTQTRTSATLPSQRMTITSEFIDVLRTGQNLTKVKSLTRRYNRHFSVDEDGTVLTYSDSRKGLFSRWWNKKKEDFSKISIKQIVEVRDGNDNNSSRSKRLSKYDSDRSFTLVIGEERKRLTLMAPNQELKFLWTTGIQQLMEQAQSEADPGGRELAWLNSKFREADKNGNGLLDADEILHLLKSLSFCPLTTQDIKRQMKKQSANKEEFVELYRELSRRTEVEEIFHRYVVGNRDFLRPEDLCSIFEKEQNERLELSEAVSIIEQCEPCPDLNNKHMLTMAGFNAMMASKRMNILKPICRTVYQDMTRPLSDYFISSSHNTYLEGNQLYGNSSVAQYERVLARRCRCVELDVWDGDNDEPIIYHGYTMTTKIAFRDVLIGIAAHAFEKSPYPVILSIENHCSVEQQRRMAKYLHEIFGSKLFVEPLDEASTTLPSPEQLKNRIIVKGKKLPANVSDEDADVSDEDEAAEIDDEDVRSKAKKKQSAVEQKSHLAKELSDCVVICQSASFKSFEQSADKLTFAHISSFEEEKAMKLSKEHASEFVKHNAWQLSRIYPAGMRTNSSNYDPIPMWNVGCQLVALNFQTKDDPMLFNYGRFQDNGNCGYVLKPKFMRPQTQTFDPQTGPFPDANVRLLTIRIISGFILPKKPGDATSSILDPYVSVEIMGVPDDNRVERTPTIENNGFHPCWNTELTFTVRCPDLALVMFRVIDEESGPRDDVMVAQYCLPFNCMQTGYRMVALRDINGNVIGETSLFLHISVDEIRK